MKKNKIHIVVADDSKDTRDTLVAYLIQHNYKVTIAANRTDLTQVLKESKVDLVILETSIQGESGLFICRDLRETQNIPIILLTTATDQTDKILGFEMGADDYVTKPFDPRELIARIKCILRRANTLPHQFFESGSVKYLFSDWLLNIDHRTLRHNGRDVRINRMEFKLLETFLNHPKIVLSRDNLLTKICNRENIVFDRSIDNQISRLRKKIEVDPQQPKIIKTVWGIGYKFALNVVKA